MFGSDPGDGLRLGCRDCAAVAELAGVVVAPGPHGAVGLDRQGGGAAGRDRRDTVDVRLQRCVLVVRGASVADEMREALGPFPQ